jgi:hypothetical protein
LVSKKGLIVLAAVAMLAAGCGGVMRMAYNNGDFALRMMADDYFDLHDDQEQFLKAQLARFHQWHRREELPAYARTFEGAADRIGRGLARTDVVWALDEVRERYRTLVTQAAEDAAPVIATLKPENFAALEKRFADNNAKFTKEYLSGDQTKRDRARARRLEERFESFMGDLTGEQRALIVRFAQSQPRMSQVRLEYRTQRQREFVALLRQHGTSPDLGARLQSYFVNWERDRSVEHERQSRDWEDRLVALILDMDRTMTPEQRAHAVQKFASYADDCMVLARQGRDSGETRAAIESPR